MPTNFNCASLTALQCTLVFPILGYIQGIMAVSSPERSHAFNSSLSPQSFTTTLEKRSNAGYDGKGNLHDWCRRFCWNPDYSSFTGVSNGGLSSGNIGYNGLSGYNNYNGLGEYNNYNGPSEYQPRYSTDYNNGWGVDCWMCDPCRNRCSSAQILIQTSKLSKRTCVAFALFAASIFLV